MVEKIAETGIIGEWLQSDQEDKIESALYLMRMNVEKCSDRIASLLEPYAKNPDWSRRIISVLMYSDIDKEQFRLFAMRLRFLLRGSMVDHFILWQGLCKKRPQRAIVLLKLILTLLIKQNLVRQKNDYGNGPSTNLLHIDDVCHLADAVKLRPLYAWQTLTQFLFRYRQSIQEIMNTHFQYRVKLLHGKSRTVYFPEGLKIVGRILGYCLPHLWKSKKDGLFDDFNRCMPHFHGLCQREIIQAMTLLPNEAADTVIGWLSKHSEYFELGSPFDSDRFEPVRRVIEHFLPFCSTPVCTELEKAILNYRDKDLAESYLFKLKQSRVNLFIVNEFGRTQQVYLSAIPREMLSVQGQSTLRIWEEKFRDFPLFEKSSLLVGGWVVSTILREKLPPNLRFSLVKDNVYRLVTEA